MIWIFFSLPHHLHLREAALVAHHEERGCVGCVHEVVEVERFPENETRAAEGVAGLELGVHATQRINFIIQLIVKIVTSIISR